MTTEKKVRPLRREEVRKYENICTVFGSRYYNNFEIFDACIRGFIKDHGFTVDNCAFVSGVAKTGADKMIVDWCIENDWNWHEVPARWDDVGVKGAIIKKRSDGKEYNAAAGFLRNQEMANISTHAIGFWNGNSTGTKDMIDKCSDKNVKIRIIRIGG